MEDRLAVEHYATCAIGERWPEQIEQLCQTIVEPSLLYLDQLALAMFSAVRMNRIDRAKALQQLIQAYPNARRTVLIAAGLTRLNPYAEDIVLLDDSG